VYLQGEYTGGTWAVYIDAAGSLCGATASGDAGSAVCGDKQERAVTLHDNDGNAVAIFGTLPEGAADFSIPGSTGSPQTNEIDDGRAHLRRGDSRRVRPRRGGLLRRPEPRDRHRTG
jgi:hypothetical protein